MRKGFGFFAIAFAVLASLPETTSFGAPAARPAEVTCDYTALRETKAEFTRLRNLRRRSPDALSDEEFRAASNSYIYEAERCYQAHFGVSVPTNERIDDGGLWMESTPYGTGSAPAAVTGPPTKDTPRRHVLVGTKWGADSPFGGGPEATGPRSPGGVVSYSFMGNGVSMAAEPIGFNPTSDPNTAIGSLPTFLPCFYTEIEAAFAAWSAVANIQFTPATDNGLPFDAPGASGQIRIGAHAIDGPGSVIAHAYFPPPNGTTADGDLHFDESETWNCDPASGDLDFGIVALHEIGHSVGLSHESTDPAVMEAIYNPAHTYGPLADDIIGIGEIYGGSPLGHNFFFGNVGIGTDSPTNNLHIVTNSAGRGLTLKTTGDFYNRISFDADRSVVGGALGTFTGFWKGKAVAEFQIITGPDTVNKNQGQFVITTRGPGDAGPVNRMLITSSGRVGIGTNGPQSRLHVANGDIRVSSGSFIDDSVTLNAPDYVFEPDYELMPISQLADFVTREKHLPNVPSAKEIKERGLNLSRLQMRLLEKIEELTLYTIEQQKRLETQSREIDQLKARLKKIEVRNPNRRPSATSVPSTTRPPS